MKLYISSDHAGFELKAILVQYYAENGIEIVDMGPHEKDPDDDYPDFISLVAQQVSKSPVTARGIVIGYSGQGEAIVANKYPNVRAGVFYGGPSDIPKLLREHNDSNVISLGAGFLTPKQAEEAVDIWIETQFSNEERHKRRIEKIMQIDVRRG
jgi:ribose 5-phosphate isomerase B